MLRLYIFLLLFMSTEETGSEIDLVFALNTPSMMSATDLSYTVDFLYDITNRLTIGKNDSLLAVLTYSKYVFQHFNLSTYSSKEQVLPALLAVKSTNRTHEESNPNEVLDYIRTQIYANSRVTSMKIVLLTLVQAPQITTPTMWAADDLSNAYHNSLLTFGLDSLTERDKNLLQSIAKDDSRTFYVSDLKYSCHVAPNITNLIDSTADTSLTEDCPDPYATEMTTNTYSTKDDSVLLMVIGALIGTLIVLVGLIIAFKCVKGNAEKDLRVLRAIEVYGEARLGTSKGSFCHEDLGKSEEVKSTNNQRMTLARNFSSCNGQAWNDNH